jgi:hypothetical protein
MIDQPPFPLPGPPPPVLLGPPIVVGPGGRPLPPPWMHDVSYLVVLSRGHSIGFIGFMLAFWLFYIVCATRCIALLLFL